MTGSRAARALALATMTALASSVHASPVLVQAPIPVPHAAEPFAPDADQTGPDTRADKASDTWIFSGSLTESRETFSGTLVTGASGAQFELKLAGGATCDGSELTQATGLVRLSSVTCSDGRAMRALFVPQGGQELKVFGHVADERFATLAHLLGTQAPPEKPQTAAPKAPDSPPPAPAPATRPDKG